MRPEEVEEKVSALRAENERLKNSEALVGALLEWIEVALEGGRLSDFAESFPIVRKAVDAIQMARQEAEFLKCERDEAHQKREIAAMLATKMTKAWEEAKSELERATRRQGYAETFCLAWRDRAERAEFRGARIAWKAVLSLLRSGTPIEGLEAIAEHNLRGLETLLGEEPSEHGR